MTKELSVTLEGRVAVLEVRRGPANYFNREILAAIADTAAELTRGDECRAIVLCSEGKHFCAGADFAATPTGEKRQEMSRRLYTEAIRLFEIRVPVIAAVQGAAVGGGLGLACAADFRVASATSRLQANFARLGFHQGFGLTATLPRITGHQTAIDLLYSGRPLSGAEALEVGLVDRVTDAGREREAAVAWAQDLAASAPLAVRSIKESMRTGLIEEVKAALDRELTEQARLWVTDDSREGIAASLERRPASFEGR